MSKLDTVKRYFKALTEFNVSGLLEVFTSDVEIHNVNFPVYKGVEGVRKYCENFQGRIAQAKFDLLVVLEKENFVLAEWEARLTYREGAQVAGVVVGKPFTFSLRGMWRADFVGNKIQCLRIYHETTTAVDLARANAKG
ncbi:MAG: nuclear transport factor 2 family protein [Nanoarchaeota archaeon]